ncbi:MAG: prolipoprotein diacylglyceryl transferase, partial [candidate division WOR-3 bacterium]
MFPILIRIGSIPIYSYGLMLAISFLLGIYLAQRWAKRVNIDPKKIEDLGFWILIAAVIGARALYIIFHPDEFLSDPLSFIKVWQGGLMFFGGFIGAVIASLIFLKKNRISILKTGDLIAPVVALGEFLTRIGCFLNGCCFGIPTNLPWGIKFPEHSVAGQLHTSIHPTQLYSSLFGLLLFIYLLRRQKRQLRTGQIFSEFLIAYAGF